MSKLHLFEAFGIELEYMLVDRDCLRVRPLVDSLLAMIGDGRLTSDVEIGPVTWSNELVMHVVELKSTTPVAADKLDDVANDLQTAINGLNDSLQRLQCCLLPTAMHPWMDPKTETVLWPHENFEIYSLYDRIFGCRSHGWANVQSVHLNLPFSGDEEFARLHAAVRLVLPMLPAIAASSPLVEGKLTGLNDNRLHYYLGHCQKMPSLMGNVIPEPVFDEAEYRQQLYRPIAEDVKRFDTEGVMEVDFLNARGAIARFDRGSIEIRLMDVQEYPRADVAICTLVIAILMALVEERWVDFEMQKQLDTARLRKILDDNIANAEHSMLVDQEFLKLCGISEPTLIAGDWWKEMLSRLRGEQILRPYQRALEFITNRGTLATRITRAIDGDLSATRLSDVYRQIADCLTDGTPFAP